MSEEEGQGIRGPADNPRITREPKIIWDESRAMDFSPDTAQVKATKEEVWLFLGMTRKGPSEPCAPQSPSGVRIILSPYTAKQLSIVLNTVLRKYETNFGPVEEKPLPRLPQRKTPPPFRLPPFRSEKARERVGFLFELLNNLDLKVGLERSFKVSEKTLLPNRFLLGFIPDSSRRNPYEKILNVCKGMRMPEKFLHPFERDLPEATMVGFGVEEDETACVVKAYLEFKKRYAEALKKGLGKSDSYVSHWGYKWDSADNTRGALAKYTCFPALSVGDMLGKIADAYYREREKSPLGIVRGIVEAGSRKVGPDKFLYLEVNEENNPRSSYDINLYGANLRLEEIHPYFQEMCRHFVIPAEGFRALYEPIKNRTLGHLAGGVDRKGRDFLTVYFGE
jgi:hypothetical protein